MANEAKTKVVEAFTQESDGKSLIFFDYNRVRVDQMNKIRGECREKGSALRVIKNTLLKRALEHHKLPVEDDFFHGMTGVVISDAAEFGPSGKILLQAEGEEIVAIKGGVHEAASMPADLVRKYARLPSLPELQSMLVGALEGVVNNLVVVLGQVVEQKGSAPQAEAAPAKPVEPPKEAAAPEKVAEAAKTAPQAKAEKAPESDPKAASVEATSKTTAEAEPKAKADAPEKTTEAPKEPTT